MCHQIDVLWVESIWKTIWLLIIEILNNYQQNYHTQTQEAQDSYLLILSFNPCTIWYVVIIHTSHLKKYVHLTKSDPRLILQQKANIRKKEKGKNYEYDYKSSLLQDPQELVKKGTINWCTWYNIVVYFLRISHQK